MGDLSVDVASLRALSGELRCGADELGAALHELSGMTPRELGTTALDEACQDFHQRWQHGLSLIRDNVTKVGSGLESTADTYEQHEKDLAQMFAGIVDPEGVSDPFGGLGGAKDTETEALR